MGDISNLTISQSCNNETGSITATATSKYAYPNADTLTIAIAGTTGWYYQVSGVASVTVTVDNLPNDNYTVTVRSTLHPNPNVKDVRNIIITCAPVSDIAITPIFTLPATVKFDISSNLNIVSVTPTPSIIPPSSDIDWTEEITSSTERSITGVVNQSLTNLTIGVTVVDVKGFSKYFEVYWKKDIYVKQCGANQSGSYTATKTAFSTISPIDAYNKAHALAVAEADANLVCDTDIKFEEIEMVDLSFAVSYSLEGQCWTCFHDYVPDAIFCTANKLMSFKDHYIYLHNQRNRKGSYYNKFAIVPPVVNPQAVAPGGGGDINALLPPPFKSQIEFVVANLLSKAYHAINWKSQYKTSGVIDEKKTFTAIMLYNHNQCSGEQPITLKRTTRNAEGVWRFNDFRDLVKDPNTIFLDKDGNVIPTNIMANKSFFKQSRFIGDYICVRMIFDNANTLSEIVLSDFSINDKVSYR